LWCELGTILPQKIMNRIVYAAFLHPKFVPQLSLFAPYCTRRNCWLFCSILRLLQRHSEFFQRSIAESGPVWDFILPEIACDLSDKSEFLETPYDERPFAFLVESVIFAWPMAEIRNVTISSVVAAVASFCAAASGWVPDELLSYLAPLFPAEVVAAVAGKMNRLNAVCLEFLIAKGFNTPEHFTGNTAVIAMKLLPRMTDRALAMLEGDESEDAEIVRQMFRHLNTETKYFIT
jgi:hypothetical protein